MGWVHRRRDLGSVIFIHLRDREGVTQVVFHEDVEPEVHERAELLRSEYVVAVEGTVALRTPETINPNIPTGEVEIVADKVWILNESRTPPFPMEETRRRQRRRAPEVSLRRSAPAAHAAQHHAALEGRVRRARSTSYTQGFLEIETPFMTRSTPEGARDYLVPSRVQPGTFLRAAAIAADLQAAADGQRLRQVFPDRALFPRRGSARRPPARVHADRSRDVVSAAGADLRSDRAAGAERLRGRRASTSTTPLPAPDLRRGDALATAATSPTCAFRRCIRWKICCRS